MSCIKKIISISTSLLTIIVLLSSCEKRVKKEYILYEGPMAEIENVHLFYSDSAKLKTELTAGIQLELKNKDRIFPKGLNIIYYDKNGDISSTMRADSTYHVHLSDIWYAYGDVQLKNTENGETLFTEELTWKPTAHLVETDKFVHIVAPDQDLRGTGLTAKDDFSEYEILDIQLEFDDL